MPNLPTVTDFEALVGQAFEIDFGDAPVAAELVEAKGLPEPPRADLRQGFSLLFRCPDDTPPEQGIYRVSHQSLEPMAIFMVPIGRPDDGEGLLFEAVFN